MGITGSWHNLPKRLTEQEATELLPKVRCGDDKARTRMIEGYMRLAAHLAVKTARKYPLHTQEIFSTAFFSLCDAVDRVSRGVGCLGHDNISAYIHKYVKYEILEVIKIDYVVVPPLNSEWLINAMKEHGTAIIEKEFGTTPYVESPSQDTSNSTGEKQAVYPPGYIGAHDPKFDFTYTELLESVALTDLEKQIIKMRVEGWAEERIGRAIGYTQERVSQLLELMDRRVREAIEGKIVKNQHWLWKLRNAERNKI
jgi:DNA-directed RNA polymerase specialized sigma subunit